MKHELKSLPKQFAQVESGEKPFEVRIDDRGYKVGDELVLNEYDNSKNIGDRYTGRQITVTVTYIYRGDDLYAPVRLHGWMEPNTMNDGGAPVVVMAIRKVDAMHESTERKLEAATI